MRLTEIKSFFTPERIRATNGIKLDVCSTIVDGALFVETHIATLEANPGNKRFMPYYERLIKTIRILNK